MYKSHDDIVRVEVVKDIEYAIFPPADVSILPLSDSKLAAQAISTSLFNTQTDKQLLLLLPRSKKTNKINTIANVQLIKPWKFLDIVSITYERPGQSNGNCLVQLSEVGFLFYKGLKGPDITNTKWFREEYANAGTHWDLGSVPGETNKSTFFQKFSGELVHLLVKLASPLHCGRVVWGVGGIDDSAIHFIHHTKIPFHIFTQDNETAEWIIKTYNSLSK